MLDQVLKIAGIVPDYDLDLMKPNQNLTDVTAQIICGVGKVLDQSKPDRVIVQGDTTTAMGAALAAFYRHIPVDHVEAGLRSGNMDAPWPEELNRRLIGSIASLHFAPTRRAAEALLRENISADRVFVTGNTVVDALLSTKRELSRLESDPDRTVGQGVEANSGKKIILVTSHRRENFDRGISNLIQALRRIARRDDCLVLFPVHPNPNVRGPIHQALSDYKNVHLLQPLDYAPFVSLLCRCHFVMTDSGGIQEEAPALGKPVLIMRETTERPEGVDAGTALLLGTDPDRIFLEASRLLDDPVHYGRMSRAHNPFGDGKASHHIRDILKSKLQHQADYELGRLRHAS
jgi:UDP-N-acetylglucosamine 2-epimerase (non-hydrolysing)